MAAIRVTPLPTEIAEAIWAGAPDANGMAPERYISDGNGVPCRHCLQNVAAGAPYLAFAHRPFPSPQPYAEVGPIFLHAERCAAYADQPAIPAMHVNGEPRIVRAYGKDNRIRYGTGKVVPGNEIAGYASLLLDDEATAYVHVRSSTDGCYTFRIDRA